MPADIRPHEGSIVYLGVDHRLVEFPGFRISSDGQIFACVVKLVQERSPLQARFCRCAGDSCASPGYQGAPGCPTAESPILPSNFSPGGVQGGRPTPSRPRPRSKTAGSRAGYKLINNLQRHSRPVIRLVRTSRFSNVGTPVAAVT